MTPPSTMPGTEPRPIRFQLSGVCTAYLPVGLGSVLCEDIAHALGMLGNYLTGGTRVQCVTKFRDCLSSNPYCSGHNLMTPTMLSRQLLEKLLLMLKTSC